MNNNIAIAISSQRAPQTKPGDVETHRMPWTPSVMHEGESLSQRAPQATLGDVLQQMLNDTRVHQQSIIDSLQRPKVELMSFDGDPLKYWPFVRAFRNAVDSKSDDDGFKLNSLIQFCTGKVKGLLQCCLVKDPTEGYELAWQLLKERFGNVDVISQAWITKILDRPKIKDIPGLQVFADDLHTCREVLITMGYLNELETRRSLCQIVEKLPDYLHSRWLKVNHTIKNKENRHPNLADVIRMVTDAAQQASDPVFGRALAPKETVARMDTRRSQEPKRKQRGSHTIQATSPGSSMPAVKQVYTTPNAGSYATPKEPCVKCGGSHYLTRCQVFKALRVKDRLAFVQSKRLCVNCFKPGHLGKECGRPFVCTIDGCGQKPSRFLHLPVRSTQFQPTRGSEVTSPAPRTVTPPPSGWSNPSASSSFVTGGKG